MADEDDKGKGKIPTAADAPPKLGRRDLLMGLSTVPALGLFGYAWGRQQQYRRGREAAAAATPIAAADLQEINVALLGAGAQGQVLMEAMLRIPGLRFRAVCDIWTEYNLRRVVNTLKRFKQEPNGYADYREMLDKEKELDAVIVATPDFWHARHTTDALKAGKHVYCEKEMSNTLEGARSMVLAQRETGKLLQIGHQRRSNPRYPPLLSQAARRGEAARTDRDGQRAMEPCGGARPRSPRSLRDSRGHAEAVRVQGHASVPQLALVQRPRRRTDRRSRIAPNRHLQLVPRRSSLWRDGQRRAALPRSENPRVARHGHGRLRLRHAGWGRPRRTTRRRRPMAARATTRPSWATRGRSSSPSPN